MKHCISSQGYYLDEWLVCELNQVQFGTYASDIQSLAESGAGAFIQVISPTKNVISPCRTTLPFPFLEFSVINLPPIIYQWTYLAVYRYGNKSILYVINGLWKGGLLLKNHWKYPAVYTWTSYQHHLTNIRQWWKAGLLCIYRGTQMTVYNLFAYLGTEVSK